MPLTTLLLWLALALSLASATGKVPLWPAVFVLTIALLVDRLA